MNTHQEMKDTAILLDKLKKQKPDAFYYAKGYIQRAVEEQKPNDTQTPA